MIASGLQEHFDWIDEKMKRSPQFQAAHMVPGMAALGAYFAEGTPHIVEFERSEDSVFHEAFHAVGSGAPTAYAVWRTLGGKRLRDLSEGKAIHVALRIMRTAVAVDVQGVSEPFTVFVLDKDGARALSGADVDSEMQAVEEWEKQQISQLLDGDSH